MALGIQVVFDRADPSALAAAITMQQPEGNEFFVQ